MAKLVLNDVTSGYSSTTLQNANNAAIEAALENTLSRDGTSPNMMSADLDMNGYSIINELATTGEGFVRMGAWVTATEYAINNLVSINGSTYICTKTHVSGVFADDLNAVPPKWEILAAKGADGTGGGDVYIANNLSEFTATATTARGSIAAAKSGANADITSLSGLTTPLSIAQGGTGAITATLARTSLDAAQLTNSLTGTSPAIDDYIHGTDTSATGAEVKFLVSDVLALAAYNSTIRVNSPNGFGSTNTGVRRFSTTVTSSGTDITYADSATAGASFTINTTGMYSISYTDAFSAAGDMAITLNATGTIVGLPATLSQILAETTTSASAYRGSVSVTVYLTATDIIRPVASAGGSSRAFFTISRVG